MKRNKEMLNEGIKKCCIQVSHRQTESHARGKKGQQYSIKLMSTRRDG